MKLLTDFTLPAGIFYPTKEELKLNNLAKTILQKNVSNFLYHLTKEENLKIGFSFYCKETNYWVQTYPLKNGVFFVLIEENQLNLPLFIRVFEKIPCFVIVFDTSSIIYTNPLTAATLGCSKEELLKTSISSLLPSLEKKLIVEGVLREEGKTEEEGIYTFISKNGEEVLVLGTCFVIEKENKKLGIIAGIDITYFSEVREKIEEIYKKQDISDFFRNILHDFNNFLKTTLDYLEKILESANSPENVKYYTELTKKALNSWIEVNRMFLTSYKKREELGETELVKFLKDNLELFHLVAGTKVNIQLDFDHICGVWVQGDDVFWRYIFLNFISNARDAIKTQGIIEIKLRVTKENKTKFLLIIIKDNGEGISLESIDKIFQPFFSTKSENTGLGLFLVKKHIEKLGGKISVESKPKEGTTFKILVPLLSVKKLGITGTDKYIVVIEDEDITRELIIEVLKEQGYNVFGFKSFEELKKVFKKLKRIDLLITDYHLPEIKGSEVFKFIKEKFPESEVLFLTGDIMGLHDLPSHRVLLKPFRMHELISRIKQLV